MGKTREAIVKLSENEGEKRTNLEQSKGKLDLKRERTQYKFDTINDDLKNLQEEFRATLNQIKEKQLQIHLSKTLR